MFTRGHCVDNRSLLCVLTGVHCADTRSLSGVLTRGYCFVC